MHKLTIAVLFSLSLQLAASAVEFVGLEKLAALKGKFPEPLLREDIGIGKKIKYKSSTSQLVKDGDSPKAREAAENSLVTSIVIAEVVSASADRITLLKTTGGTSTKVVEPRGSMSSRAYWENMLSQVTKDVLVKQFEFVEAEFLGTKKIKGFECYGVKLAVNAIIETRGPAGSGKFTLVIEEWFTMDLPADGVVHTISVLTVPYLQHKSVSEDEYLGRID